MKTRYDRQQNQRFSNKQLRVNKMNCAQVGGSLEMVFFDLELHLRDLEPDFQVAAFGLRGAENANQFVFCSEKFLVRPDEHVRFFSLF